MYAALGEFLKRLDDLAYSLSVVTEHDKRRSLFGKPLSCDLCVTRVLLQTVGVTPSLPSLTLKGGAAKK